MNCVDTKIGLWELFSVMKVAFILALMGLVVGANGKGEIIFHKYQNPVNACVT